MFRHHGERREHRARAWRRIGAPLPEPRIALHSGDAPLEGFLSPAYAWTDVLHRPPPRGAERDDFRYCTAAPFIESGSARIENVLVVTLGADGRVKDIEDRLVVAERVLAPTIEAERRLVGAPIDRARQRAHRRIRHHRRRKGAAAPSVLALHAWDRALAATRTLTRGTATMPDRVLARGVKAAQILRTPEGRARVRRGLTQPRILTAQQKAATLFVGTIGILGALLALHTTVTLAVPGYAYTWRTTVGTFLYAYLTSVGIPLPLEPVLVAASLKAGQWPTYFTAVVAKVLAAWMVFFLGDEANEKLRDAAQSRPLLARWLDRCERFAQRFGGFALATFIAVPGLPDAVALYLFGSLHMRMRNYLIAVAAGGAVLYALLVFGVGHLVGTWLA